jgi:hypothetical protein
MNDLTGYGRGNTTDHVTPKKPTDTTVEPTHEDLDSLELEEAVSQVHVEGGALEGVAEQEGDRGDCNLHLRLVTCLY